LLFESPVADLYFILMNSPAPVCPVCAMRTTQLLCNSYGHDVWRCPSCCCDFVWPQPSANDLKAYYDQESYFQGERPGSYANYDLDTEAVLPLYRDLLQQLSGETRRSILDIGCAYGTHLAIASEQGWDACGVEVSEHARQVARQRLGDKVAVFQSIEEVPQREYDLITLFDVLEHLPQPYEVFERLFSRGLIGEHTVVALTTPNARSSHAVSDPVNWPYRHPPAHLFYYSSESLTKFWAQMEVRDLEVRGIYLEDHREPSNFSDEDSSLNSTAKDYAGLLCIARGFKSSPHFLMRKLEEALEQMRDRLADESAKLQSVTTELETLRKTKWFRLRDAMMTRPITLRAIFKAAYLVASIVTPRALRGVVRRHMPDPSGLAASGASQVEPYVVRQAPVTGSRRPRVVHVIANFMTGGSSRLVVDLIERLGHYEQSVVTSFIPKPPAYVGLEIAELSFPKDEQPFVQHFLRAKATLIHVHYWGDVDESWYAKAINAAKQLGIKVVENINTPVQPYFSTAVRRYVYVSDYVRQVFGRADKSHVTIYPGSDFSHFNHQPGGERAENCVGMVYRLERDKLGEDAILPFIAVVRRRPQTRVLIVGGGDLLEVFRKTVADAGFESNFEFSGYVGYADLPDFYRRMSLFVAPVRKESFGQVSAFAMNMGIPVCGYDVGAIPEIVEDRSLLARAGDAEGLASVMIRLLDSPEERARIGEQQHLRAQACFSVEAMGEAYGKLYRELLSFPA